MAWIHIRHRVADYNKWKEVFDEEAELKREYGWKRYRLFFVDGDRNDILVMEEFERLEEAQRFVQSKDLRNAMDLGGVVGEPDIWFLQGLEEGLA
jgi:hypothetical protein